MKWKILFILIVLGVGWTLGRQHTYYDFSIDKCRVDSNRDVVCYLWVKR